MRALEAAQRRNGDLVAKHDVNLRGTARRGTAGSSAAYLGHRTGRLDSMFARDRLRHTRVPADASALSQRDCALLCTRKVFDEMAPRPGSRIQHRALDSQAVSAGKNRGGAREVLRHVVDGRPHTRDFLCPSRKPPFPFRRRNEVGDATCIPARRRRPDRRLKTFIRDAA
jgi:hypothetical protein